MIDATIPSLVYLTLLALALIGWFLVENRASAGRVLQQAMAWFLIFIGTIAAVGLWNDVSSELVPRQAVIGDGSRIDVPQSPDGHYHLVLQLDGTAVDFVVDTGATNIVLSKADARRIGIDMESLTYASRAMTANGIVETARTVVGEIELGGHVDENVVVWVNRGDMSGSLLGMDYLERFARIEISDGRLILER